MMLARKRVIISLDGGGTRGYSSVLILEAIMEQIRELHAPGSADMPLPCEWFDLIGGTSTGGLIAIMLGRLRMSLKDTLRAYREMAEQAFIPKRHHLPYSTSGKYSATALEKTFQKIVRDTMLDPLEAEYREPNAPKTVVLAAPKADVGARPTLFKSYDTGEALDKIKIWEVARATSAASTFFKSIKCGRDNIEYIDAGFGTNNPSEILISEAEIVFPASKILVISIGTGLQDVINIEDSRRSVINGLKEMATSSKRVHRHLEETYMKSDDPSLYCRFDVPQGIAEIDVADWKMNSEVASHTLNWLKEVAVKTQLKACARSIIAARVPVNALNIPSPNTYFIRPQGIFEWLDDQFRTHARKKVALTGMAGVGKTQIAIHYAETRQKLWGCPVFWINGQSKQSIKADYDNFRTLLRDPEFGPSNRNIEWLVIADDISDPAHLREYELMLGDCAVLYTTRDQKFEVLEEEIIVKQVTVAEDFMAMTLFLVRLVSGSGFNRDTIELALQDMKSESESWGSRQELRDYLDQNYGIKNLQQLSKILKLTEKLPLALALCAAYIRRYSIGFQEYVTMVSSGSPKRFLIFKVPGSSYSNSLMEAFDISFKQVEKSHPRATKILQFLGFLDRRATSQSFLKQATANVTFWNGSITYPLSSQIRSTLNFLDMSIAGAEVEFRECIGELVALSLVDGVSRDGTITIHSLVQEWLYSRVSEREVAEWLEATVTTLTHRLPPLIYSAEDEHVPEQARLVLCHVDRIVNLLKVSSTHLGGKDIYIRFLLEAYLWYCGEECLQLAEQLVGANTLGMELDLATMVAGARALAILQKYQQRSDEKFEERKFTNTLNFVSRRSTPKFTYPRDLLTFAEIISRLERESHVDKGTMTEPELRVHELALKGVRIFLKMGEDLVHKQSNMSRLSINDWYGVSMAPDIQNQQRMFGIGSAIIANVIALPYRREGGWDYAEKLFWSLRNEAVEQFPCQLPELERFFPRLVEASSVVLRGKENHLDKFVKVIEFCLPLVEKRLLSIHDIDGPIDSLVRHYGKSKNAQDIPLTFAKNLRILECPLGRDAFSSWESELEFIRVRVSRCENARPEALRTYINYQSRLVALQNSPLEKERESLKLLELFQDDNKFASEDALLLAEQIIESWRRENRTEMCLNLCERMMKALIAKRGLVDAVSLAWARRVTEYQEIHGHDPLGLITKVQSSCLDELGNDHIFTQQWTAKLSRRHLTCFPRSLERVASEKNQVILTLMETDKVLTYLNLGATGDDRIAIIEVQEKEKCRVLWTRRSLDGRLFSATVDGDSAFTRSAPGSKNECVQCLCSLKFEQNFFVMRFANVEGATSPCRDLLACLSMYLDICLLQSLDINEFEKVFVQVGGQVSQFE